MPKQVLTINDFSGGLNSHSDPRDIDENQFASLKGVQLARSGIISFINGEEASSSVAVNSNYTIPSGDNGGGVHSFSTDYDSSNNANPTDWLVYHEDESGTNKIKLWDGSNLVTLTAPSGNLSFYDVDGILRYSDTALSAPSKQYGFIDEDLFVQSNGTSLSPRSEWVETNQDLGSFGDNSITLALDNSSDSNPDTTAIPTTGAKIVLAYSKYSQNRGRWTGVFEFGIAPVYKGGQEGKLEGISGTVQLYKHKMSFKLYVSSGVVQTIGENDDSILGDDRITGANVYFKRHGEEDWFLLREFDLIKGEPYNWEVYNANTDTAEGIWAGSLSIAMKSGASVDQFKDSTVNITYSLTGSMDSTRSGFLRVFGFLVNPVYMELPSGTTSAGEFGYASSNVIEVAVKIPEAGDREVYCQVLDEELNVVKESGKAEITFAIGSIDAPSTEGGANNPEDDQAQMECFLPNTKILMANGSLKNIIDVEMGDMVVSYYRGEYLDGMVTDALIHPVHGMANVAVVNKLHSTANHPIMINGIWSEIQNSGLKYQMKKMFVDAFYNLEIDGHNIFGSEHNFIADGYIVSGLGDSEILNKVMPRQQIFIRESLNA
jgi:hypothetical protein